MPEENVQELFDGYGIPVEINDDDFLKIKETLTRMGVGSYKNKVLFQSCHILHKRGYYAILHFKELFALDGREANLDETDIIRRNTVAKLLEEWGLLKIIEDTELPVFDTLRHNLIIVPYAQKSEWELKSKYNIGVRKYGKTHNQES